MGYVKHRRFQPKLHIFKYQTFMYFFDIAKIDGIFAPIKFCSVEKFNWQTFRRKDYGDDRRNLLDYRLRELVKQYNGIYPDGEIYLITQLACLGYCFNPITVYLVFNKNDSDINTIVLEVTNTPWSERHHYILPLAQHKQKNRAYFSFKKALHVSPFMTMDYQYHLYFKLTVDKIILHIESYKNEQKHFDATLSLRRLEFSNQVIRKVLLHNPLSQYKVTTGIYWQALKLWLKGIPFCTHPKKV